MLPEILTSQALYWALQSYRSLSRNINMPAAFMNNDFNGNAADKTPNNAAMLFPNAKCNEDTLLRFSRLNKCIITVLSHPGKCTPHRISLPVHISAAQRLSRSPSPSVYPQDVPVWSENLFSRNQVDLPSSHKHADAYRAYWPTLSS
jgi:hypothetical protein